MIRHLEKLLVVIHKKKGYKEIKGKKKKARQNVILQQG